MESAVIGRVFNSISLRTRGVANQVLASLFPQRLHQMRRNAWQKRWANDKFSPVWQPDDQVPVEIQEAVDSGFFPHGSRLLDIGCGTGWITAWLSSKGYKAMGVDYAPAAIDRAKATAPERTDELEWRVVDILQDAPPRTDFDVMIDRGCLHRIPFGSWDKYARHVCACGRPGAKFWLIIATFDHEKLTMHDSRMTQDEIKQKVSEVFTPYFTIDRAENTQFIMPQGDKMAAAAFWMTVRGEG